MYLVFEDGDHVYAYQSLKEAGEDLESMDYLPSRGAFSDQGELITMAPGDLFVKFRPSGTWDRERLKTMMRRSRGPQQLVDTPHLFALQVWLNS